MTTFDILIVCNYNTEQPKERKKERKGALPALHAMK